MTPPTRSWHLVGLIALLTVLLFPAPRPLSASHFSWLGHGADVPAGSTSLGPFIPTFYRILDETSPEWTRDTANEALLSQDGHVIARVSAAFKQKLDVEGSARLRDGRVVNLDEPIGGRPRYLVVRNAPFGVGVPGYKLIPYRTVAVDPHRIKLGTVVYLPSLAGITLPSGETHDGFCFAHDVGRGITGNRIDIFVGFERDLDNALTRSSRIASKEPVRVYRVDGAAAQSLNARFRKDFTWHE
jgi:3D (Asp-Asp-Asp) domain-containing protein